MTPSTVWHPFQSIKNGVINIIAQHARSCDTLQFRVIHRDTRYLSPQHTVRHLHAEYAEIATARLLDLFHLEQIGGAGYSDRNAARDHYQVTGPGQPQFFAEPGSRSE